MKTLNKNILAISMAAAMTTGTAQAVEDVSVSGFVDVIYTVTNEGADNTAGSKNAAESKFLADGEVDFAGTIGGATVGLDVDVRIAALGGDNNAEVEQAFFAVPIGGVTVIGGVFNNPIGYEAEDAPNLDFTSHNIIYDILNNQTALYGNNLAGAAVVGKVGDVTLTGAFVNDLGHVAEENSFAIVANLSPMKNLDVELGYVTQDDTASAGNVLDINAAWSNDQFSGGIDYMNFGELLDDAIVVWGGINVGDANFKVRFETVAANGGADAEQITVYGTYPLAKNTIVALEIKDGDLADSGLGGILTSAVEGSLVTVEFIGTF